MNVDTKKAIREISEIEKDFEKLFKMMKKSTFSNLLRLSGADLKEFYPALDGARDGMRKSTRIKEKLIQLSEKQSMKGRRCVPSTKNKKRPQHYSLRENIDANFRRMI